MRIEDTILFLVMTKIGSSPNTCVNDIWYRTAVHPSPDYFLTWLNHRKLGVRARKKYFALVKMKKGESSPNPPISPGCTALLQFGTLQCIAVQFEAMQCSALPICWCVLPRASILGRKWDIDPTPHTARLPLTLYTPHCTMYIVQCKMQTLSCGEETNLWVQSDAESALQSLLRDIALVCYWI